MKRQILALLSCFCLLCGSTLLAVETATQEKSATETYTNKEKNYSLQYPSEWQKKDVPALDLVLFATSKDSKGAPHASMNVVSEKLEAVVSLDQFYSESVSNLSSELKEVQIESSGERVLNGVPSKWILYSHVMQGTKFRVLQYFLVSQETVYLLTFSALADDFNSYKTAFESVASTFRLLTTPAAKPAVTPSAS